MKEVAFPCWLSARPGAAPHPAGDDFGRAHLLVALDYKQLPPATSRPPFIDADHEVLEHFEFRVLRENRRLASSDDPERQTALEQFHHTLEDISMGRDSAAVRDFFVAAYARGAGKTQSSVGSRIARPVSRNAGTGTAGTGACSSAARRSTGVR